MEQQPIQSSDAASADAAVFPATSADQGGESRPAKPIGRSEPCLEPGSGRHIPEFVQPLTPKHPESSFTDTKRLRHDGWTPDKQRLFLDRLAECGIVTEACFAAGMSARSAYNLRDRDTLFAAGWEAACVMARRRLADEAFSRAMNGVVERIYRDGVIVAERHRHDNRLTMAVLARLDSRIDRAEERGSPHLGLVARWDEYLEALGEDRREDGLALLAPPVPGQVEGRQAQPPEPARTAPAAAPRGNAGDHELCELRPDDEDEPDEDRHDLMEIDGRWWTDYPPPPNFQGEETAEYGSLNYRRTLSPAEQAVVDAEDAADLARAEAQRDAWFGFTPEAPADRWGAGERAANAP
jgi:hypothetical protein